MDLSDMRMDYTKGELRRSSLKDDAFEQFSAWFEQACASDVHEPNAFSLATVGKDGQPSLRTVLLKYFDQEGLVFFTNYESNKAMEIGANNKVSMLFPWLTMQRQVIVKGCATKVSAAESLKYFLKRPKDSKFGAWISRQKGTFPCLRFGVVFESNQSLSSSGRGARAGFTTVFCTPGVLRQVGRSNGFLRESDQGLGVSRKTMRC
jgi:pyridoxamine-phosphate oxidase